LVIPMHYLIDGHNLISKLPDIHLDDPDDEVKLALRLKSWVAAGQKRRVTLFFDGGLVGGKSRELSGGGVTVIFAPAHRTADALIISRIEKVRNPAEHTLVSSDREVVAGANRRRMPAISAEAFALQLGQETRLAPVVISEDPALSEAEVAEWLALFGPERVRKARRRQRPPVKAVVAPPAEATAVQAPAAENAPAESEKTEQSPLNVAKETPDKLSEEEVAAWLELFNRPQD
jgi:uncharacterized protein